MRHVFGSCSGSGGTDPLFATISVDREPPDYFDKETVVIHVAVVDQGGNPIANATVDLTITTADLSEITKSELTNGAGIAEFTHRNNVKRDGAGPYGLSAIAQKGQAASAEAVGGFSVE